MGDDLLAAGQGNPVADQKAKFALGLVFDAFAPTNFLPTNPAALKRAFETGGASVLAGARNFLDDVANNHGRRGRLTARHSSWAATSRRPPGRWCTATT